MVRTIVVLIVFHFKSRSSFGESRPSFDAVIHMIRIECHEQNLLFSLIGIRFGPCEVWYLNLASGTARRK